MPETPLRTEQFGRRYRRNRPWAVRDLSLAVPEGSITALVGPDGAGKSTLIRACLGLRTIGRWTRVMRRVDHMDAEGLRGDAGASNHSAFHYRSLSIANHLTMAAAARPSIDPAYPAQRMRGSAIALPFVGLAILVADLSIIIGVGR